MTFSEFSIKKPVFTIVCSLMIILLGALAISKLPLREYPYFENPSVSIHTAYPGANPKIVEKRVTAPLEKAFLEISGIDSITSHSSLSGSNIDITFKTGENIKELIFKLRTRISELENLLPKEAKKPSVHHFKESSRPNIFIALYGDQLKPEDLFRFAKNSLSPAFRQIPGVSTVKIGGTEKIAIIEVSPDLAQSFGLTINDIMTSIEKYQDFPGGVQEYGNNSISNLLKGKIESLEDLKEVILVSGKTNNIKLKDIAKVYLDKDPNVIPSRINGKNSTLIKIHKEETANPITISSLVKKQVEELQSKIPKNIQLEVVYDNADFIKNSLDELKQTVLDAALLVILIIFIFLRSARATLVALITIPTSLMGALFCLYMLGYSINTMTLLALVLAIGMVVDDAIVVLENIYRYIEKGLPPYQAAIKGSKEVTSSVIAMTLTLACVFFPLFFIKGFAGSLFIEFGIALTCAVLVSGYVALSTSAMLSAYILKKKNIPQFESRDKFYYKPYKAILSKALNYRYIIIFLTSLLIFPCIYFYESLPKELAPSEDRGIISLGAYAAGNPNYNTMKNTVSYLEKIANSVPETREFVSLTWNKFSQVTLVLEPWKTRERSVSDIMLSLKKELHEYPAAQCYAHSPSGLLSSEENNSVTVIFKTPYDTKDLHQMVEIAQKEVTNYPGLTNFQSFLNEDIPENHFIIDYDKVIKHSVSPQNLSYLLQSLFKGIDYFKLQDGEKEYRVKMLYQNKHSDIEKTLTQTFIKAYVNNKHQMLPLSQLVKVERKLGQESYSHFNGSLAVFIKADLTKGYTPENALTFFEKIAKEKFPPFSDLEFSGSVKKFQETNKEMFSIFIFACLAIYLVLAAQFESFVDPLIVLLTIPLAVLGSLISLNLLGSSLNFYSQIGIVTLIGIITKHGILIVDFANEQIKQGKTAFEATLEASVMRLRPILMTTLSTIFGAIPLVISTSAGKELRFEIGSALIGGLLLGTLLTLLVIPCFYLTLASFKKKIS
ncbi:Multidrug resistance protein MdtC [Chlamydiales bacterium SCGC AB-751-O23]|nr:Multidrug resistance protein MdtC [Chlamydiales bacterium SCGC AB-751-O23]